MILERGALLNNRYRIVEILGQGGMGSVYRAVDENLGMEVAVKDNLFTTEDYARQFRREATILANLRHPNLPRVTDHFVIEGQGQYLVMDYIEGEDLRQRMDRTGLLAEEEVIVIGAAVCDALTYLDSRRPSIIHRDIKPGNVKITPNGHIFLVDFGLAKTLHGSQATTTGARAMTPGYSPPEQYGTARTDQRSDIFSLGATLYAALTGAIPEDALARAMDQVALTPIRKHNPRVGRRIATVIEKSLAVRPDDRFQDSEEFKQALLSARSNSRRRAELSVTPPPDIKEKPVLVSEPLVPVAAAAGLAPAGSSSQIFFPISTPIEEIEELKGRRPRSRPRKRRSASGCLLVLLLGIVLLLGGVFVAYRMQPALVTDLVRPAIAWLPGGISVLPFGPRTATPTPTESAPPEEKETATPDNPTLISETTPPAALLPATATPTSTPRPKPTVTPNPTPTFLPTPLGGGAGQLAFAAEFVGNPQVFVMNADGTGLRPITDQQEGACQPDWSPDGSRLVFISPCEANSELYPGSAMFLINADATGLIPLPTVLGGDFDPSWSPDGTHIAFTSIRSSGRPEIYLMNLEDNSVISLSEKYSRDYQPFWSPDGKKIAFISERRGIPQVWVMNSDGSDQQPVTQSQAYMDLHPSFTPDGQSILYTQLAGRNGIPKLAITPCPDQDQAANECRITKDPIPMREARVSPDGYWIAFEGWPAGSRHDIYIMAINGAGRKQLESGARTNFDPDWRPQP